MAAPKGYNWPSAFVGFCQGHPLEEISEAFGIPLAQIREARTREKWDALREQLPLSTTALSTVPGQVLDRNPFSSTLKVIPGASALPETLRQKLEVLVANRKHNYEQANRLRKHIDELLTKLESNELKVQRVFPGKGKGEPPQLVLSELGMQDLVALATYAKMVQDMTYKALGDTAASDRPTQDGAMGQTAPPPITIILPGCIAEPREKRAMTAAMKAAAPGAKIVDVESTVLVSPDKSGVCAEPAPEAQCCPVCGGVAPMHDSDCTRGNACQSEAL